MGSPGKPSCTDDEFIKLWYETGCSPTKIGERLGCAPRSMHARKRSIENNRKIKLPTMDDRPHYNEMRVEPNRAVVSLQVSDGVVLVGSDAHIWPGPLTTMQRAMLVMTARLKPKAIIANGDFFDGGKISRHPSIGWEKKPELHEELEAVQDYMSEWVKVAGKAKRIWPIGNHDMRFESRVANQLPEFAKIHGVHLKDHFPLWTPCWRVDINDDVVVRHRELGGEHADFRNVQTAGKSIVTGHDHRTGVVHWCNYAGTHYGVRCGFMGDSPLDPQFVHNLEGKEPNWHPALVALTFLNGRLLWPELVTKHDDDHVQFRGEVIKV